MENRIIISIVINALITAVTWLRPEVQKDLPAAGPIMAAFVLLSVAGAALLLFGARRAGAVLVIVGCAAFVPIGLIGLLAARGLLKTPEPGPADAAASRRRMLSASYIAAALLALLGIGAFAYHAFAPFTEKDFIAAVGDGDVAAVRRMLGRGADPNAMVDGYLPLSLAVWNKNENMVSLLLDKGADIESGGGMIFHPPLFLAANRPDEDAGLVRLLLSRGAQVGSRTMDKGGSPLHGAAEAGYAATAAVLLDAGADVNARDNDGATPLHLAAQENRAGVVELLLGRGADRTIKNNAGLTAAQVARSSNAASALALLEKKAGR